MQRAKLLLILLAILVGLGLSSCTGEKETLSFPSIAEFAPLTVGKYITYRVDSLVFTNFGRNIETHKYQMKHMVDAIFPDGMGRPSYRIIRYINDSTASKPWVPDGTYYITSIDDQLEVVENNQRVIKLHQPLRASYSWKGNRYLPYDPYEPLYNFSNDDAMADWNFIIDGNPSPFTYRGITYNNVLSVEMVDESFNIPIINPNVYASRSRAVERFSKGIGLIFRQHELWEHQPNTGGSGGPYKVGFGITQWMIDHN
jgi:hypothetical protein